MSGCCEHHDSERKRVPRPHYQIHKHEVSHCPVSSDFYFFSYRPKLFVVLIDSSICRSAIEGECGFLAANLYAKSVFGEDALVNVSIEKQTDGALSGYIRIRSKTQGIALSLGDKITLKQKGSS